MKLICLVLATILVTACVAPQQGTVPGDPKLLTELRRLPGAVVGDDGLLVSYPDDSLFGEGAVLPLPGGMTVLTPLIDTFLRNPGLRAEATVRSSGHTVEYDRILAGKRKEFLEKIFRSRGLDETRIRISPDGGEGAPFSLQLQSEALGSSSGAKL